MLFRSVLPNCIETRCVKMTLEEIARLVRALDPSATPVVWEKDPRRASGAIGYRVISAEQDERRDYRCIFEASGDASLMEPMIGRLRKHGEIVLAGFYDDRISFGFLTAFHKEVHLRITAEWGVAATSPARSSDGSSTSPARSP